MIEISLFVDGEHYDTMKRKVCPRVGETIVLDCGDMVRITEVSHGWDEGDRLQVQSERVEVGVDLEDNL